MYCVWYLLIINVGLEIGITRGIHAPFIFLSSLISTQVTIHGK
jgi:hypothetical protein